uniref:Chloride channel protein n=1 Tax=Rhabditophanes sp. KR3021 TaxID=114890 RepID=A0AC35TN88_9BILA
MSGILKRELAKLDHSYSYENTMQLGRFRCEDDNNLAKECIDGSLQRPGSVASKVVRFDEFDPREEWKHEKRANTWGAYFKRVRENCQLGENMFQMKDLITDWLSLAALGVLCALCSILIDKVVDQIQLFQMILMTLTDLKTDFFFYTVVGYLGWLFSVLALVLASAAFVHFVAPQAIGSGIPEMKTILRGVVLKDFLTLRTLISKVVGLTLVLASGIPVGKMGPFVHISAIIANLISCAASKFDSAFSNEARKTDMLAAGCAIGVACTFSAPIGGVLFSIEVTTMYFSVRNYWRGFFAATCGATVFRILKMSYFESDVTLLAFYQTNFPKDAFVVLELPLFALLGFILGIIGVIFISFYKNLVMFLRTNQLAKRIFQKHWIVYPSVVAFIVASTTFPRGTGRFLNGRFKFTKTLIDLFSNCSWHKDLKSINSPHGCDAELLSNWTNHEGFGPYNVFMVIFLFAISFMILSALSNTMPTPCGMFMPLFVVGASFGRLYGECVSSFFPDGMNGTDQPIFPGIYAVIGAAALTGAITHSVSVAVICCELTGQVIYLIPLMIAVLVANGVSTYFTPSIYDVIIKIKHLPYLPEIPSSNSTLHMICAEQIMVSPVEFLSREVTFAEIRDILINLSRVRAYPVVDNKQNMILLGSVSRRSLLIALNNAVGDEAQKKEATKRIKSAIFTIDKHFKEAAILDSFKIPLAVRHKSNSFSGISCDVSDNTLSTTSIQSDKLKNNIDEEYLDNVTISLRSDSITSKEEGRFTIEPVLIDGRKRSRRNAFIENITDDDDSFLDTKSVIIKNDSKSEHSQSLPHANSDIDFITFQKNCQIAGNRHHESQLSVARYFREAKRKFHSLQSSVLKHYKDDLKDINIELDEEEKIEWEEKILLEKTFLGDDIIDPAPFQLVRKTSLFKVHSLFSLLELSRAYVTDCGRLIGVVALKDLRIAIQNAQNSSSTKHIRDLHRRMSLKKESNEQHFDTNEENAMPTLNEHTLHECEFSRKVNEQRSIEPSASSRSCIRNAFLIQS